MLVLHCSWPIPRNESLNGWIVAIISIKQVLVLKMQEIVSHLLFLWNGYASIKSHFVSVIFLYLGHAGFQVFDWNKTRPNVCIDIPTVQVRGEQPFVSLSESFIFLLQFRSWKISEKLVLWQQTRTGQIRSTWWICSFTSYLNKTTALKAPLQSEPHFSNLFPSHLPLFDICSRVTFIVQLCVLRASLPVGAWYELIQVDSVLDHHRLFSMKYISMYFLIKIRFIIN